MKLSLALSTLLVGATLFINGCGSGSSDSPTNTGSSSSQSSTSSEASSSSEATAQALKFTTEMLAGKTFYAYGLEPRNNNESEMGDRFKAITSADASSMEIWSSDASEKYGDAKVSIITDSKGRSAIKWQADGMSDVEFSLLKVYGDGSLMVISNDSDHPDPYPQLFAVSEMADKGKALYDEFAAEQIISKDILSANPWYGLDWSELHRDHDIITGHFNCQALFTFKSNNKFDLSYVDENGEGTMVDIGDYVISDNRLDMSIPSENQSGSMLSIVVSDDTIIFDDKTAYFKNRADAITFMDYLSKGTSDCSQLYPEQ